MTGIGIIGVGFMGYTHFTAAGDLSNAKVTAIATRSERKRQGDWSGIQGNFGPPAGQVDLAGINTYADYHDLLADPAVDLVDICLPTDLHEQVALDAVAAGKAVLLEKPIAIDLDAAERIVNAASDRGVLLMVAQVLPFFPEFRYLHKVVDSGRFGSLQAAHFRRVICPPDWSDGMADFRKLGGWGIDLHIHDNHYISLICGGAPRAVFARGLLHDGFVNHVHSQYLYENKDLAVSCVSGGIAASGLQFVHGFEVYLQEATLIYEAGTIGGEWVVDRPLTLVTNDGKAEPVELEAGEWYSAFTSELQTAVDAVTSGKEPFILSGGLARDALRLCHAEAKSIADGRAIEL